MTVRGGIGATVAVWAVATGIAPSLVLPFLFVEATESAGRLRANAKDGGQDGTRTSSQREAGAALGSSPFEDLPKSPS